MAALISVFIVLILSLLVNRIATVALTLTGLSRQAAQFQARSAFTGAGFTTNEAEQVVNHPVRRRIVMLLMLLGNAGIVTSISSVLLTFIGTGKSNEWMLRAVLLAVGLVILWFLATSKWIDHYLSQIIEWTLRRWTRLEVRDYVSLLNLSGEYGVTELEVQPEDWLADRKLTTLELRQEGVVVLGIRRSNGRYVGVPKGQTYVHPGDILILYGRMSVLSELDERKLDWLGEQSHQREKDRQKRVLAEQERQEAADGS